MNKQVCILKSIFTYNIRTRYETEKAELEKKMKDLENRTKEEIVKVESYWTAVVPELSKTFKSRAKKSILAQRSCPIAGCPSHVRNLRRHFSQCHKAVPKQERDQIVQKYQEMLKKEKKVKVQGKSSPKKTMKKDFECQYCSKRVIRIDAHLLRKHFNNEKTEGYRSSLRQATSGKPDREIKTVTITEEAKYKLSLSDSTKTFLNQYETYVAEIEHCNNETARRHARNISEFLAHYNKDDQLVNKYFVLRHPRKVGEDGGFITSLGERMKSTSVRKYIDSLMKLLHFLENSPALPMSTGDFQTCKEIKSILAKALSKFALNLKTLVNVYYTVI